MKRLFPFILITLGVIVILAGFTYNILYAGIPYQDPTPALEENYNFHSKISTVICLTGLGIFFIGGATITSQLLRKDRNPERPKQAIGKIL